MKLVILLLTDSAPQTEYEHFEVLVRGPHVTVSEVKQLVREHNPVLLLSAGAIDPWVHLFPLPLGIRKHWSHVAALPTTETEMLQLYLRNSMDNPVDRTRPLMTVFTTSFHSKHKIRRPLESLQAQTYPHWEWIVVDDSTDDETYGDLQRFAAEDSRIRVLKPPVHSGFIGATKQLSARMARGKWLVEVDHDDVVDVRLLEMIADVDRKYPDAEFIYSDFVELFEEEEHPFAYAPFFGFGYGAYVCQHLRGKYHNVAQSLPLNPTTLSHIVGYPNHVRAWKTSVYHAIGGHNHLLPVVDDMELMLRTFLHSPPGTWVRICAPLYYQYRNAGGNNFTLKRNALIQALVPLIYQHYLPELRAKYEGLLWDFPVVYPGKPVWELEDFAMPPMTFERFYVPQDQDAQHPCVSVVLVVDKEETEENVRDRMARIRGQTYDHWLLFVVAAESPFVPRLLENWKEDARVRYYNFSTPHTSTQLQRYALMMVVKTALHVVYLYENKSSPQDPWTDPSYLQAFVGTTTPHVPTHRPGV